MVALEALKRHVAECVYRPVVCTNERCRQTVHMKDLDEHMTKLCEYRLLHCNECDENMSAKKYGKHVCLLRKEVDQMKALLFDIKRHVTNIEGTQNRNFVEVLAGIQKVSTQLVELEATVESSCIQDSHENNIVVLGGMSDKHKR